MLHEGRQGMHMTTPSRQAGTNRAFQILRVFRGILEASCQPKHPSSDLALFAQHLRPIYIARRKQTLALQPQAAFPRFSFYCGLRSHAFLRRDLPFPSGDHRRANGNDDQKYCCRRRNTEH